ncbi:MAG: GIY-YIG nuclease family protein [Bacteroidetes bacterium]|nr:GIY-YIG nuclease family protein [Bacteroidota bacterium]MBU1422979.1 GIY-YIG nuclease family protein [Bacteroidota bacterium]
MPYIGHTGDLEKRMQEHNSSMSHSTKRGHNWQVMYLKEFSTRSEAMKHERYLKSSAGRRFLIRLLGKPWPRGGVRPKVLGTE